MVIGYILAIIITKVIDNLFKEKEKAK
jgi:hypothetical protein